MRAQLGVFLAYFVLDLVWAVYTRGVAHNRRWAASITAAVIPLLSGGTILAAVHDPSLLLWAALGGAAGTWFAMSRA